MSACNRPAAPELAEVQAAVALALTCARWRWMPGMLPCAESGGTLMVMHDRVGQHEAMTSRWFPHPRDPATLGCLHALVEGALGAEVVVDRDPVPPGAETRYVVRSWSMAWGVGWPRRHGEGVTRFVALARALMGAEGGS